MAKTYNPIISKEEIPRLCLFQPRLTVEPGVALVLSGEGQPVVTLWPGDRLTAMRIIWDNYKIVYKVDVAEHWFGFDCTLPCKSDVFAFQAEVRVVYCVYDPAAVVECNVSDSREALIPLIVRTMCTVSRDYDVEEIDIAEKAIADTVEREVCDVGFKVKRCAVNLSLDEDVRAHIRKLRQIESDKERERREGELQRQRDELELERMRMRMDSYNPLIKKGHWQLLALQLTNHPEDVAPVAQMLSQNRQALKRQLEALMITLETDILEDFQVEEVGKRILQRLVESLEPVLETKPIGGDEAETIHETLLHGPVTGVVHTGSGDIHIGNVDIGSIHRYSDISFPSDTMVGQTEALRVAITLEPFGERAVELALDLMPDKTKQVRVDACAVVSPMDFEMKSPSIQSIEVLREADSKPIIFTLVPKSIGRKTIAVEFFQDTRYLGRAEIETTVGKEARASRTVSASSALALRLHQLAPDLTIYVEEIPLGNGRRFYRFLLLSPIHELNLSFEEVGEIDLQAAPEVYFEAVFAELNEWLQESDVDEDVFFKRLNSLGTNLYGQLFPDELKRIYWERLRGKVETMQIISTDPWIPWELVRPYHPDTLEEDDFLCEQFALTRWLAGPSSPDVIDFRRLALVVAASDLPSTLEEAETLRQLAGIQVKDIPPSLLDIYDLLETGGFDGLHFACHGEYDRRNPDQSVVLLEGGQRFRPNDIAGKKRAFGREAPLVFLNACETGRAGLSLTGLGGWAKAFIGAGAGGFVGSTWEAHDDSAYKFAVAFYGHLLEGKTVAEATRLARRSIRRAGDPTWLSYTVYANPLARLAVEAVAYIHFRHCSFSNSLLV